MSKRMKLAGESEPKKMKNLGRFNLVVGLTGPFGSGSSETQRILSEKNIVIDGFRNIKEVGMVPRFVGKRLSGKKAFIALGLTAGMKTAPIRWRRTRAVVLVADKAINAIGCSGTEQPDCPNLWDVNKGCIS